MRGKTPLLISLVLIVAPLAGCVGSSGDPGQDAAPDTETNASLTDAAKQEGVDIDSVEAPEWEMLDWWEYEASGPWTTNTNYKVIVHMKGDGYVTATDTRDQAVYDMFWGDPFIGDMDEDLNPADDRFPDKVFDWPLTPNKTWSTQDGEGRSWDFVAHQRNSVDTPEGEYAGYHIAGESEDNWRIFVTYVPGMNWFTNWMLHNATDEMLINVNLQDRGTNYTGDMFVGDSTVHVDEQRLSTAEGPKQWTIPVEDADTDLHWMVARWSAAASGAVLLNPAGEVAWQAGPDAGPHGAFAEGHIEDPAAGDWELIVAAPGDSSTPAFGGSYVRAATFQMETMNHG